ncbi:SusC/RagA family TonB-linked outer membrane protein [Urechidicola croceus]|uniref:TonB-dependent receptor plug domain-containing protein n=1 Tax=Urechidicola croceus TaxID=1850246 RepID=A0A1D8PB64_9FLAO|nr:SusC/RagA family TonB-linked outer membrane protein [Urechidicola croceus]AOW21791.1 hypothetical protein LPB138_14370 [Urechidicola croceus]
MKTKFNGFLTLLLVFAVQIVFAQTKTISGVVTDDTGSPLPGVSILIKGTTTGTETDFDGNYSISANVGDVLQYSFIGMGTAEMTVGAGSTINVTLESDNLLDEVVVTALGISREKKSLGYSSQQIGGEEVSTVKVDNVVNSLSGKISGVQIKANNNFGGSANFLIRGASSLGNSNQPLFVIDGMPVANTINNSAGQRSGSTGYDYGNAASDINPDDVESVNVLKGSAATALYGSRGANGVVIITTKKGKTGTSKVTVTSGVTVGTIDKNTFIEYQDKYGAGYGPYYGSTGYFEDVDVDGDGNLDLVVPTYDDASYGAPLDGTLVYQWDAFVPESANYLTATPYVAAKSTPVDFFETALQLNNSVAFEGGNDKGTYRLGYTNFESTGVLPNSKLNKNSVNFNGTLKINDKFEVGTSSNLMIQKTKGRNSTGYSDNLMSQFRQWYQVNVDIDEQREIFQQTGKNYSWNHQASVGGSVLEPLYWDNPYWTRYKNYQTDSRNRFYGNIWGKYNLTDWLDFTAKVSLDTYKDLREERRAVGSVAAPFGVLRASEGSGYDRKDIENKELNVDFMLNYNKDLNEYLNISGVVGTNFRREKYSFYHQSTSGGIVVPELYSLRNSANPVPLPVETLREKQVNGVYTLASLAYKDFLYLDGTYRYDISSALPPGKNGYPYFSVSSSLLFSQIVEADWLNFGKFRAGYAEVGNDLDALNVYDTYNVNNSFGNSSLFSFPNIKNNDKLVPERSKEIEFGLETRMFSNRVGLDFTWYKRNTEEQLLNVSTTTATGFSNRWVNSGEVENKGFEIGLNLTPVKTENFTWDIITNFSKNENTVIDLYTTGTGEQVQNIPLASYQGGITINATLGEPLGTIRGTGFVFDDNGNRVVDANGYYLAQADQVLGNVNPDWTGGFTNKLTYKNASLSFLIDVQKGGDVYSLDMHYGQGTGLGDITAGLNELGNPVRDPITDGPDSGGILNVGVTESGEVNTVRARADYYGGAFYWGNSSRNPAALTVYDASYVKLRELAFNYNLPTEWFGGNLSAASVSLVGRNLWIIDKNVPYADPESGLGAGNAQGYLSGAYPTVKTVGLNLNLQF